MERQSYEIDGVLPELRAALTHSSCAIVSAPPGSGKSTVLPLRLLEEKWLGNRKILLLQPRRIAARNVAFRLAEQHGSKAGSTIGYRVRFESCVSTATKLEVITEGILIRLLQEDPALEQVGLLMFDEFHERNLQADLALALALDAQATLRPDLRILVMSATLDSSAVAKLLGDPPTVASSGRQFPVAVDYLPEDPHGRIDAIAARYVAQHFSEHDGDTLVFLPGVQEIRRASEEIGRLLGQQSEPFVVLPLFGDLPFAEQQRALQPDASGFRKIIVATPIAETSLTIEGVTLVVDSGMRNSSIFDPSYGLSRFQTERITKDSADQRAGRAGRLGPGRCLRLWSANTQRSLREHRAPEMLSADLAGLALELAAWGTIDPTTLRWIDLPPESLWVHALATLRALGAIDDVGRITQSGRDLHRFGAHPRIAQLLLSARRLNAARLGADLAALLEERDPFALDPQRAANLEDRLEALQLFRAGHTLPVGSSKSQLARIDRAAGEWRKRVTKPNERNNPQVSAGLLLSLAFPERIARQRSTNCERYLTSAGTGLQLRLNDPLLKHEFLVAVEARVGPGDSLLRMAAPITFTEIEQHHHPQIITENVVRWDERNECIAAERTTSLGKMPLGAERLSNIDETQRATLLIAALSAKGGANALPWPQAAMELRYRAQCARAAYPELNLPDLSDEALSATLDAWLSPLLTGVSRFEQLQRLDLTSTLHGFFTWEQRRDLDRIAPTQLQLPAGKVCRIDYSNLMEGVLAAMVQDLFGLHRTPILGEGRIPLCLHLLSPARRPVQVTRDLESFWRTTYQQVKKELKGRYPKHYWPEDPLTAPPKRPRRD